ncbi:hypothetical protein PMAYCL1PPCAC_12727 [Pristionchus mayeri]|uniref:NB-ARC domain-containing protein n=1 Tax=Pristionchus mayeri TaxID=1317129 RepID=A0AAN4ZJP0_9BILA|nr:hypothetical protein PMAYCL1PPCAC_12727 [Pristionchus mayeri]
MVPSTHRWCVLSDMLGEAENRVLRRLFIDYGEDIDTNGLITYLEIKGIISEERAEVIANNVKSSNREKQSHLIRTLIRQSTEGLHPLVSYFQQNSVNQRHISDWLSGQIREIQNGGNGKEEEILSENEKKRIKWMLVTSRVPSVRREMRREELMGQVKDALAAFSNDDAFFVVLHGLPGSGKSSLAASVVREEELFLHQFDSVIWMMDQRENARDLTFFMADLLVYLTDSTELTGKEKPPTDKSSIVYLMKLVSESLLDHPNTLLVVDGVMTPETVSWIDHLNVRVLATTRNALLFEDVSQPLKMIKVNGLEESEVAGVLAEGRDESVGREMIKRVSEVTEGLPHLVKQLHKLTVGKKNELDYYISRIDRSGILSLPNANSYNKEKLRDALENHYSMMLPELREPLNSLVVFPPSVFIPLEVLSAIVPIDVVDSDDVIHELAIVMERLAKLGWVEEIKNKEDHGRKEERREIYRVPRIVHEFLVKKVEESERSDKKKQLMSGEEKMGNEDARMIMREWLKENSHVMQPNVESPLTIIIKAVQSLFSWVPNLRGST